MEPVNMLSMRQSTARWRPNAEGIVCAAGIVASGALLVASRLSEVWLPLEALSHFTLHLVILLGAFLIGFFMPYGRTLAAMVLVLIGFVGIGAYAHYVSAQPRMISSLQPGERALRLMTFNTSVINTDLAAIAAELRRLNPDVVIMMEFSERKRALLDDVGDLYPYNAGCVPRRHCHFALLSKVPIAASRVTEGWDGPLMIRATLGGKFAGLDIVGVHFPRLPHIKAQFEQLAVLLNYLDASPGASIVMGDFNATPFSRLIAEFSKENATAEAHVNSELAGVSGAAPVRH